MASDPRSHRRYRKLRAEFFEECRVADAHCWICSLAIDYGADLNDRQNRSRWQLDHLFPVADHPDLAMVVEHFRPSHAGCNQERGKGAPVLDLVRVSRDWTKPFVLST